MANIKFPPPNEQQTRWSLFLGILIWFLYMNTLNALISISCKWGWFTYPIGGLSGLQFVELSVSLVALVLMLFTVFLPWRYWRTFQTEKPVTNPQLLEDTEKYRRPLMAFVAMSVNGFFFLFTIATFVPVFLLKACGQA